MNVQNIPTAAHPNVFVALAAAQAGMGTVVKGAVNPAFKSRYADLADVVAVVVPALSAQGIAMFHSMARDDHGLMMRTTLYHGATDTRIDCDVPLIVSKNDMQGMKSATTYAKRIGLESLTGIAPEDDDGNAAAKAAPMVEDRPAPRQAPQKEQSRDPAAIANGLIATFAKAQSVADLEGIISEGRKAAEAWDWLEVEAKPEAARVKAAFDEKKAALQKTDLAAEIPY